MPVEAGQDGGETPEKWRSVLIDVSRATLAELVATDDSALAHALRRVTDELDRPGEPIAGFNSAI
ncbi:FxSxx-COOH cyclophane-containing RiPP peptide [Actinoplanes missouriensis]|uniref:FxSxx-COOH cyclophane-containing RiPP peptide n=1 Tax=Actinoplanes missouriensis TaxID=1866 RepID=UPI0033D34798